MSDGSPVLGKGTGLAAKLRRKNDPLFTAALSHPFVKGIGDGSLPRDVFARWIVQDWLYLQGYVEALKVASALAPNESSQAFWGELVRVTLEVELELHRGLASRFNLSINALDNARAYEATTDYLATFKAASQSYPTLVATLTPCAVGYAEIALVLDQKGTCSEPDYAAWIKTYTDPAFQETVVLFTTELDQCGESAKSEEALEAIEIAYTRAALSELLFWEGLLRGW